MNIYQVLSNYKHSSDNGEDALNGSANLNDFEEGECIEIETENSGCNPEESMLEHCNSPTAKSGDTIEDGEEVEDHCDRIRASVVASLSSTISKAEDEKESKSFSPPLPPNKTPSSRKHPTLCESTMDDDFDKKISIYRSNILQNELETMESKLRHSMLMSARSKLQIKSDDNLDIHNDANSEEGSFLDSIELVVPIEISLATYNHFSIE